MRVVHFRKQTTTIMETQYFTNKELQFLKTFIVMLAALPVIILTCLFVAQDLDNRSEMLIIFFCISAVMIALSAFVWKKMAALPEYYLSLNNGIVSIPKASFLSWNGTHLQVKKNDISQVIHDEKSSGNRSNLVLVLPAEVDVPAGCMHMVLGHMRFEKENNDVSLVICGLKKKDAELWKKTLAG